MADSDRELVRRAQDGDPDAFNELVLRHQEKIFNAVYRFCSHWEDACDITQRAFVNAFRKIGEFKGDSAFTTWMYRIAFNQSVSFRRETGRQKTVSLTSKDDEMVREPAFEHNPSERLETDDSRRKVQQALAALDDDDRKIIVLKDLQGYSYDEIAAILDIPKGTVRSRLHRARLALKTKLKSFAGTARS
ncbi:MAG: sigma-70 family RNA polymerase sigma factor [Planctomycetes bacterium]|nr:sigma-70 family RNA polymerase sigma factor [Planctomycetota bacterium]